MSPGKPGRQLAGQLCAARGVQLPLALDEAIQECVFGVRQAGVERG